MKTRLPNALCHGRNNEHRRWPAKTAASASSLAPSWPFIGNHLLQVLDAVVSEGGHLDFTKTADMQVPVFCEHVDRQLMQPAHILAEQFGDMIDGEDCRYRCHVRVALSTKAFIGRQFWGKK